MRFESCGVDMDIIDIEESCFRCGHRPCMEGIKTTPCRQTRIFSHVTETYNTSIGLTSFRGHMYLIFQSHTDIGG